MNYFTAVYLAGKISKNGWRARIVPGLRDAALEASDVLKADYKETIINLDTVHYIRKMDDPKVSQCKNIN